jgi:hypothetical protein
MSTHGLCQADHADHRKILNLRQDIVKNGVEALLLPERRFNPQEE